MKNIDALISDSDGTLVDTVKLICRDQYATAKRYFTKHVISTGKIPECGVYDTPLIKSVGDTIQVVDSLSKLKTCHEKRGQILLLFREAGVDVPERFKDAFAL
jgi:phosphoglycolate phosphatase-like HAD superfamily hydrolase